MKILASAVFLLSVVSCTHGAMSDGSQRAVASSGAPEYVATCNIQAIKFDKTANQDFIDDEVITHKIELFYKENGLATDPLIAKGEVTISSIGSSSPQILVVAVARPFGEESSIEMTLAGPSSSNSGVIASVKKNMKVLNVFRRTSDFLSAMTDFDLRAKPEVAKAHWNDASMVESGGTRPGHSSILIGAKARCIIEKAVRE